MKYEYYFHIKKKFKNKTVSILTTYAICSVRNIVLHWKAVKTPCRISSMTTVQAHTIIDEIYPRPFMRLEFTNPPRDGSLDLSIIVPVYNYASLIRSNIDSILNQNTQYRFELILVDDGSTDGAREIVQRYASDPRVKVILQENKGIAGARNTGISAAGGRYLMFVDCDDIVHEDIVEVLLSEAYKRNDDIVMCAHNLSKERDGQIISVIPNIYPEAHLTGADLRDRICNYAGLPWCKVYRRELWDNVRFYTGLWYEDTIIQFLIFSQCSSFSYVPKVEYEYRWYEKNFSHTQNKARQVKNIDCYWILYYILERYDQLYLLSDKMFYVILLRHLSQYYYPFISDLDDITVEALFILAHELLVKYKPEKEYSLPYALRLVEKSILTKNIDLWKLSSQYQ